MGGGRQRVNPPIQGGFTRCPNENIYEIESDYLLI